MENHHCWKGQKKLKYGYTTGTCAAVAAEEATLRLLLGKHRENVEAVLKDNICFEIPVREASGQPADREDAWEGAWYGCSVVKDSGDDPDVTNGSEVCAYVRILPGLCEEEQARQERKFFFDGRRRENFSPFTLLLSGGEGVGRVTGSGLEQEPGYAAINVWPRRQIFAAVAEVCRQADFHGTLEIRIVVPEGRRLAEKTFNPRLGITDGISILGTTGVLEPMSERALVDTIALEIRAALAGKGRILLVTPGNYGQAYVQEYLKLSLTDAVKCSNYIGEALDLAVNLGAEGFLLAGDIGKLVKLAAGIFQTHSRQADGRMEILGVHAAMAGADARIVCRIMDCVTTAQALGILKECGLLEPVMDSVLQRIGEHLKKRAGAMRTGVCLFAADYGMLGCAGEAMSLAEEYRKQSGQTDE